MHPLIRRRLPLDVGLRREPFVQTSQNVSRCLRGLACTRPAQVSRCRRSPRAACHAPPDTPLVGQFVGAMRSLQANQDRLTSVEKVRKRRGQQRDTRYVQQPFSKLLVGNRVSAARAVPLPLQLERISQQIVVRSSHQLGRVSLRASREPGALAEPFYSGTACMAVVYDDDDDTPSLAGKNLRVSCLVTQVFFSLQLQRARAWHHKQTLARNVLQLLNSSANAVVKHSTELQQTCSTVFGKFKLIPQRGPLEVSFLVPTRKIPTGKSKIHSRT